MRPLTALPLLCALTACAAPDLTPELDAFAKDARTANAALAAYAAPRARRELARARDHEIRTGQTVASLSPGCGDYKRRETGATLAACGVTERVKPLPDHRVWIEAQIFSRELEAYLVAFQVLVESGSPAEIGAAAARLATESGGFAATVGSTGPAAWLDGLAAPGGAIAARIAEAHRRSILRKAAAAADPAIKSGVEGIYMTIDDENPQLQAAYDALNAAARAVTEARSQSPAAHRAAIADLHRAQAKYVAVERTLPIGPLIAMRDTHAALLAALQRGATRAEIIGLLNDLNALKSAI